MWEHSRDKHEGVLGGDGEMGDYEFGVTGIFKKFGKHTLDGIQSEELFGRPDQRRYDGLHLAGKSGRYHYTNSLGNILQKAGLIPLNGSQKDGNLGKPNTRKGKPQESTTQQAGNLNGRDGKCSQNDFNNCQKTIDVRNNFQHQNYKNKKTKSQKTNQHFQPVRSENIFEFFNNSGN